MREQPRGGGNFGTVFVAVPMGGQKLVKLLMDFFETDATTRLWFVN